MISFDDFDPNKPIDDGKTPVYGVYNACGECRAARGL